MAETEQGTRRHPATCLSHHPRGEGLPIDHLKIAGRPSRVDAFRLRQMLHRDHRADILANVPLFSGCSKSDLRKIAAIADEIDIREGKVLTRQGVPGREFFVLLDGTVDVVRDERTVNTLSGGDFFGEMGLVSQRPRTATITTTSPIRALLVTETNFRRLLRENPSISMKVLEAVAERTAPSDSD